MYINNKLILVIPNLNKKVNWLTGVISVSSGNFNCYIFLQSDDEQNIIDGSQQRFIAHVPVPSQQEVEQALLRRRKQELMEKYGVQEESKNI